MGIKEVKIKVIIWNKIKIIKNKHEMKTKITIKHQ